VNVRIALLESVNSHILFGFWASIAVLQILNQFHKVLNADAVTVAFDQVYERTLWVLSQNA